MYPSLEARCARAAETARRGDPVILIVAEEDVFPAADLLGHRNVTTIHHANPLEPYLNRESGRVEAKVCICVPGEARALFEAYTRPASAPRRRR